MRQFYLRKTIIPFYIQYVIKSVDNFVDFMNTLGIFIGQIRQNFIFTLDND